MKLAWLKRSMPRSLYGRAALILMLPVVVLQVVISIIFVQRHFEDVTRQLTRGVVLELRLILDTVDRGGWLAAEPMARGLRIKLSPLAETPDEQDARAFYDLSGREVIATLREGLPEVQAVDLLASGREVRVSLGTRDGPLRAVIDRRRVSASNPHQFLVLMGAIGVLMTSVAFVYLRNQLRPITRLAAAAEAFGRGRTLPYKPSGAQEVRAAGRAFLDMRNRIERQIEQRTLLLSGVSHDLRTPLTRMKLELSMMAEDPETEAMQKDLTEMEALIDGFLDFARGDTAELPVAANPVEVAGAVVDRARRGGGAVSLSAPDAAEASDVTMRVISIERALGNLVGNAMRYGCRAEVSVRFLPKEVRFVVEDDGPGIPEAQRAVATEPFTRLDPARNQNRGSGVGLGLSIAADIARSHGGQLVLGKSARLGGLQATLVLPR